MTNHINTVLQSLLPNMPPSAMQQVVLSDNGTLMYSSEQLVSLQFWEGKQVVTAYPFLESIFHHLLNNENVTHFPIVGLSIEDNFIGYFQYFFKKIQYQNQQKILWIILKNDGIVEQRQRQQIEQENAIRRELAAQ
jgi:hydroxymethylpyrimidine pyrophosphatase-like HAD family hydrolase